MTWAAVAIGGASLIGGVVAGQTQASATQQAAQTSAAASDAAAKAQLLMFQKTQEQQEPWRQAGVTALNQLTAGTAGPEAAYMKPFGMADYQQDPGYQFRLQQGLQALDRSASARGGLLSGSALKGIQRYGQGVASEEYGNAYNRYQQQQANQFNRLAALSGVGQTATGQLQQAGQQYASNVGNIGMTNAQNIANAQLAAGQAQASSYSGIGSSLGGAYQNYQNRQFMNQLIGKVE